MAQELAQQNFQKTNSLQPSLAQLLTSSVKALEGWMPAHVLPEGLSSTTLIQAISAAKVLLEPVTDDQLMVGMAVMAKHALTFNITIDAKKVAESFKLMCATMPGDLFERGLVTALRETTDTFRLPMPGQVWKIVQAEYDKRKRDLGKLETAQKFGRQDKAIPLDERMNQQDLDSFMVEVRMNIKRVENVPILPIRANEEAT